MSLPSVVPDKLQPHSVEAEEAVLGSLLISHDAIIRVAIFLKPEDFYLGKHRFIYQVIADLNEEQCARGIDQLTICDRLALREDGRQNQLDAIGGPAYLSTLINATPTSIHAEYYARIVERTAVLRRLINAAGKVARLAYGDTEQIAEVVAEAESIMAGALVTTREKSYITLQDGLNKELDRQESLQQSPGEMIGIPTGLSDLDRLLGGLQRSDMIVMASRPGMGKTSMAISIGMKAAKIYHKKVAVFSLEMSDEQVTQRVISAEAGIDTRRLRLGDIKEDEWGTFIQSTNLLANASVFIDDTPAISIGDFQSKARRLHAEHGLDLLIVDYLQLMRSGRRTNSRQEEITIIAQGVKALAKELNIPILALSQLSRECEKRHDKRPILSDLRESGSIEQEADIVLFIYRDEVYNSDTEFPNIAEIIVAKHRNGPTGIFSVYFKKHLAQFVDLEIQKTPLSGDW
ncbi:replicative DNA helicase [Chloroflexota bacterium]